MKKRTKVKTFSSNAQMSLPDTTAHKRSPMSPGIIYLKLPVYVQRLQSYIKTQ